MAKKKDRRDNKSKPRPTLTPRVAARLREAQHLALRGQWPQAVTLLETLDRQHPGQEEILRLRFDVAHRIGDLRTQLHISETLVELRPNNSNVLLLLGDSYLRATFSAMALRTYRTVLQRWPDHARAEEIRHKIAELDKSFRQFLLQETPALLGSTRLEGESGADDDDLQLAVWHEEIQLFLERGRFDKVREVVAQLLRVRPQFGPALNNLSEAAFLEGNLEEALAATRRVLEFAPENVQALANLTRFLVLSGQFSAAEAAAQQLKAVTIDTPGADVRRNRDYWTKTAEALSFLGDDENVLATFRASQHATSPLPIGKGAILEHLAGVAAYRQGNEADARRHWEAVLRHSPTFELTVENLADLTKPAGERHAAWPFSMHYFRGASSEAVTARSPPRARWTHGRDS